MENIKKIDPEIYNAISLEKKQTTYRAGDDCV